MAKLVHLVRHGQSEQNKIMEDWLPANGYENVGVHGVMSGALGPTFPFQKFLTGDGQVSLV